MIPKDSLYTFFESKLAPDNKTTFYASYKNSSGRNVTNQYTFSNISSLITRLAMLKREGEKRYGSQWTKEHKNWNKVLLVPVQMITSSGSSTSTTSSASSFENCMAIVSTKLVGGSENAYDPIKISIVYGKFDQ